MFRLISIIVFICFFEDAMALSVEEIVQKANHVAYYQGEDGRAKVNMTIVDANGKERQRNFIILRKDSDNNDAKQKFYLYFRRPADVNKMAFLVWKYIAKDDDRWLYLPSLDLVKRIAASDKRTSFVGSHFFYEDVSGRVPAEDSHEFLEETNNYYVLKSTPKKPNTVEFSFYKSWIHKGTFLPVKIEFYDKNSKNYRIYETLQVETINNFPTAIKSKMTDNNIGGHTLMQYSNVAYNVGLPDDIFSERYLRAAPMEYLR